MMTFGTAAKHAMQYGYKTATNSKGESFLLTLAETSKQAKSRNWTLAHGLRIGGEKPFPALVKYAQHGQLFGYYKLGL